MLNVQICFHHNITKGILGNVKKNLTYSELSLRNFYIKIKFGFLDLKKRYSVQISSSHLIIEQEHFCTIILETLEKPKKINNRVTITYNGILNLIFLLNFFMSKLILSGILLKWFLIFH